MHSHDLKVRQIRPLWNSASNLIVGHEPVNDNINNVHIDGDYPQRGQVDIKYSHASEIRQIEPFWEGTTDLVGVRVPSTNSLMIFPRESLALIMKIQFLQNESPKDWRICSHFVQLVQIKPLRKSTSDLVA